MRHAVVAEVPLRLVVDKGQASDFRLKRMTLIDAEHADEWTLLTDQEKTCVRQFVRLLASRRKGQLRMLRVESLAAGLKVLLVIAASLV